MFTYPEGVMQNHSAPGNPPRLLPVGEQNWKMFAPLVDAQAGLNMIRAVAPDAKMENAVDGQYNQFVYIDEDPDVRVRLAYGKVGELNVLEYPSDIFDRSFKPQPFVDSYSPGQPHVLKCRAITPVDGELYWTAT